MLVFSTSIASNIANSIKAIAVISKISVALRNDIFKAVILSAESQSKKNAIRVIHIALLYSRGFIENTSRIPPINSISAIIPITQVSTSSSAVAIIVDIVTKSKKAKKNLIGLSFRDSSSSSINGFITIPPVNSQF